MQRPSRRRFFRDFTVGAAAATGALSLSSVRSMANPNLVDPGSPFRHGVASGDPLADRVILWTRITPEHPGLQTIVWEIAEDSDFRQVRGAGVFTTGPERDYTVKVDAAELASDTAYFFRFRQGTRFSPTGRTRTLPVGSVEQMKLAVFSCSTRLSG